MHLPANLKLFYCGAWHEPHGGYAPTMDPATNISLADAPLADASDARQAFPHWRSTTPEARCEALRKAARILRENIPALRWGAPGPRIQSFRAAISCCPPSSRESPRK